MDGAESVPDLLPRRDEHGEDERIDGGGTTVHYGLVVTAGSYFWFARHVGEADA